MQSDRALLLVDLQNDFLPGGTLAVPEGDQVIPVANRLIPHFELVIATQDWHPPQHLSFADNHPGREPGDTIRLNGLEQTLWPVHCVQGSRGAQLSDGLHVPPALRLFRKGQDPEFDSYSGFADNGHHRGTGLAEYLNEAGVRELFVMGLATDYCVQFTVLDACNLGFRVAVVEDGTRAVNLQPGDGEAALAACREAGARRLNSREVTG